MEGACVPSCLLLPPVPDLDRLLRCQAWPGVGGLADLFRCRSSSSPASSQASGRTKRVLRSVREGQTGRQRFHPCILQQTVVKITPVCPALALPSTVPRTAAAPALCRSATTPPDEALNARGISRDSRGQPSAFSLPVLAVTARCYRLLLPPLFPVDGSSTSMDGDCHLLCCQRAAH
ncbi:uncharacterized protein [Zea mays]|uniref:uncharacterized protein isoform X1 n=1 Tax=Zea mays TaxID=4577 RepID=UPI0004DEC1FD|nr:uncharacterized protein LOC103645767 isoform X1 [Zea mays]|eukprot:XP_008668695.1 uncharacterized protein LOC103645767 [Zea mays]